MEAVERFDHYPVWIVVFSNMVSLSVYLSGLMIMVHLGWLALFIFGFFILSLEYRLVSRHCVDCFYWGKTCAFGRGKLSARLFKKGDPVRFCSHQMTWKDMIPDLLVFLVPFITGIVLLIQDFNILLLMLVIMLGLLSTVGNSFIRGSLACRYCKQRDLGCPAEQLFNKAK